MGRDLTTNSKHQPCLVFYIVLTPPNHATTPHGNIWKYSGISHDYRTHCPPRNGHQTGLADPESCCKPEYLYCSDRRVVDRYGNLTRSKMKPEHQPEAIGPYQQEEQRNHRYTGPVESGTPPNVLYFHLQTMSVLFPENPAMNKKVSITFTSKGGFGQQVTNVFKPYYNNNVSGM